MDAEQIRALAVERLAKAEYEYDFCPEVFADSLPWDHDDVGYHRDNYRKCAARMVDALGDLLPTEMEQRPGFELVADESKPCLTPNVRRFVTAWTEAEK